MWLGAVSLNEGVINEEEIEQRTEMIHHTKNAAGK